MLPKRMGLPRRAELILATLTLAIFVCAVAHLVPKKKALKGGDGQTTERAPGTC
jgi:hypothetical protein